MTTLIRLKIKGLLHLPLLLLLVNFPALAQTYKDFRVGRYEGQVYNKTGNVSGKAQFDILSIAANGAVRAHLREYDGLVGEGDLSGAINTNGVMQLRGSLVSPSDGAAWQSAMIIAMQNGNLRFANKLTLNGALQEEGATMTYKGPVTPTTQSARVPATNVGGGILNGLYFHPSYDDTTVWYFGPNGRVYSRMSEGFTQAGLAAENAAYRGTYRLNGDKLIMTNANNYTRDYAYKVSGGRPSLNDLPLELVTAVANPQSLVGEYFHNGGNGSIQTAKTLILRADGTYTQEGVGSYKADDGERYGGSSGNTGTWQYANHTLTFRAQNGTVTQKIAILPPKGSMSSAIGALYLGGTFYRRKQ